MSMESGAGMSFWVTSSGFADSIKGSRALSIIETLANESPFIWTSFVMSVATTISFVTSSFMSISCATSSLMSKILLTPLFLTKSFVTSSASAAVTSLSFVNLGSSFCVFASVDWSTCIFKKKAKLFFNCTLIKQNIFKH